MFVHTAVLKSACRRHNLFCVSFRHVHFLFITVSFLFITVGGSLSHSVLLFSNSDVFFSERWIILILHITRFACWNGTQALPWFGGLVLSLPLVRRAPCCEATAAPYRFLLNKSSLWDKDAFHRMREEEWGREDLWWEMWGLDVTVSRYCGCASGLERFHRNISQACAGPERSQHGLHIQNRPAVGFWSSRAPAHATAHYSLSLSLSLNAHSTHSSFPGGFSVCGAEIWQMNLLHVSLRDSVGVNYTGGSG